MSITFGDLVVRTQKELRQISGLLHQTYSEDYIRHYINVAFRDAFRRAWWPEHTNWYTWTLDGTTGEVTDDISAILKHYRDIRGIWYDERRHRISRLPPEVDPEDHTNSNVVYWEPLSDGDLKVFRIVPITTSGTIRIHCRTMPAEYVNDDDVIHLDADMLMYAAAWKNLAADNTNSTETDAKRVLYIDRLNEIIGDVQDDNVRLRGTYRGTPNDWYTLP